MVDYRGSNAQTQHNSYTLPLIEDMLQKQHRRRIFTVIDLKHGYHQMPLALYHLLQPCKALYMASIDPKTM